MNQPTSFHEQLIEWLGFPFIFEIGFLGASADSPSPPRMNGGKAQCAQGSDFGRRQPGAMIMTWLVLSVGYIQVLIAGYCRLVPVIGGYSRSLFLVPGVDCWLVIIDCWSLMVAVERLH